MKIFYWVDMVAFLGFATFVFRQGSRDDIRFLFGMGIAASAVCLWTLARLQLGKSFSVKARAHKLVTSGLYSKFRHPVYLFAGFAFAGLFIAWGKLVPSLCWLAVYSLQLLRVRKEEKVLDEAFGEEFRQYKRGTWI